MDNQSANSRKNTNLGIVISEGETVVQEVKKHPIGATFSLIAGAILSLIIIIATFTGYGFARGSSNGNSLAALILVAGIFVSAGIVVATFVNIYFSYLPHTLHSYHVS
mgnify:CR=1 FL=1